jgi:hypothetical protein
MVTLDLEIRAAAERAVRQMALPGPGAPYVMIFMKTQERAPRYLDSWPMSGGELSLAHLREALTP